jgi:hypothetical protein
MVQFGETRLLAIGEFPVDHEFADDVCLAGMEYAGKPA